jgi:hypothetical protein
VISDRLALLEINGGEAGWVGLGRKLRGIVKCRISEDWVLH